MTDTPAKTVGNHVDDEVTNAGNLVDDEVTNVGNLVDDEVTTAGNHTNSRDRKKPTGTKATKIRVTDIDRLMEIAVDGEESPASVLTRVLDEYTQMRDMREQIDDLRGELDAVRQSASERESKLLAIIDTLKREQQSKSTAVIPGGEKLDTSVVRDIVLDTRDICGDDAECGKIISKMLDIRTHFASKAMEQEYDAEQKRLDREQKERDRKFKAEQAEKERQHRIELALAKKGGFKKEFLEDVVFIGGGSPKRPKEELKKQQRWAKARSDEEDGGENLRNTMTEGYVGEGEEDIDMEE